MEFLINADKKPLALNSDVMYNYITKTTTSVIKSFAVGRIRVHTQ